MLTIIPVHTCGSFSALLDGNDRTLYVSSWTLQMNQSTAQVVRFSLLQKERSVKALCLFSLILRVCFQLLAQSFTSLFRDDGGRENGLCVFVGQRHGGNAQLFLSGLICIRRS